MRETQCQLIILGGNHDSVATLNESKSLLACLNTTVIANVHTEAPQVPLILRQKITRQVRYFVRSLIYVLEI